MTTIPTRMTIIVYVDKCVLADFVTTAKVDSPYGRVFACGSSDIISFELTTVSTTNSSENVIFHLTHYFFNNFVSINAKSIIVGKMYHNIQEVQN